jgi:hypothetical protein
MKKSADHKKSLRTMKRVHRPYKRVYGPYKRVYGPYNRVYGLQIKECADYKRESLQTMKRVCGP